MTFTLTTYVRLKPLKPPGSKPITAPKPKHPVSAEAKAAQAALKAEKAAQQATPGAAPTLRHSTRVRVEEAEQVRQRAEKVGMWFQSPILSYHLFLVSCVIFHGHL